MSEAFLYEQLSDEIQAQIEQGTLKAGDKLPSLRSLSRSRQVSIATVTQAYLELEKRGCLSVRPQSGYYVNPLRHLAVPTLTPIHSPPALVGRDAFISGVLQELRQPNLLALGSTILEPEMLPTRALNRLIRQLSTHPAVHRYAETEGLEALRRQIAQRSLDSARPLQSSDVVVTCGCIEALNLALRTIAAPGEIIAVESPTFYGILQAIESLGMQALELPTDPNTGLSLSALEAALQTYPIRAVLTVPSFQNPLGCCMPPEHKQALLKLASRYDFQIIEDDIYGEFYFDSPPPTLYSLDRDERVILCSSFSKTLAPGFRVGWALPGRQRERFLQLKRMSSLSTASLPQLVLAEYLASGAYERHLRRLRRQLSTTVQQALGVLSQSFPTGTRISQPSGGFILWLALPQEIAAMDLYRRALKAGIGLAPGPLFSSESAYDHCFRLSLNRAWNPELANALQALGKLAREI